MGNGQGVGGMRGRLGGRRKGHIDGLGGIIFIAAAGVGTVFEGWGGIHEIYCLRRGDIALFRGDHQAY